MKVRCDMCGKDIEVKEWHAGVCPHCGLGYYWDEDEEDRIYLVFDK